MTIDAGIRASNDAEPHRTAAQPAIRVVHPPILRSFERPLPNALGRAVPENFGRSARFPMATTPEPV
jgi:hypothetical protein